MTRKLWAVIRREYVERVRTRSFVIGTVLVPLFMWGMMVGPMLLAKSGGTPLRVAVVDLTGTLQGAAERVLRDARFEDRARFEVVPDGPAGADREAALRRRTLEGSLDGYVVLPADAVQTGTVTYYGRNVNNRLDLRTMERSLGDLLLSARLRTAGLDPDRVRQLTRRVDLRTIQLSAKGTREDRGGSLMFSVALLLMLYMSIQLWGQSVMTGVIEEKGSRVLEVLASGVPPGVLLTGKLVGIGAAGFTQFVIWTVSLAVVSLGGAGALVSADALPQMSTLLIGSFVVFFVLGFVLYASLFAAIGAAVNTVQEAQTFAFPVFLPLIAGMVCFPVILESPDSPLAVALSLFPLLTPLLMFLRIVVLTPPLWQVALSLAGLSLTIWGVLWLSARIYRVGILMYGKKPTFPELLRWVNHS